MPPPPPPLLGTAGWAYPHWHGIVYPKPRPRGFHELEYLARFLDAVEINTSFHAPLKPELVRLWMGRVAENPNFQFSVKMARRFTHERQLDPGAVAEFRKGVRPLLDGGRLACVLMQFPWSFRFTQENRDFFIRLRRLFHEFPLVAEMRHASWSLDEALGTFIDYHVGFANIDQPPYMKAMPPTAYLTSPVGYVRLHGRSHPDWFREFGHEEEPTRRHDYLYSQTELEDWAKRIERIRTHARTTMVILNNDAGGKAVVNALQTQALLGAERRVAPRTLLRAYRDQLQGYVGDGWRQESLFEMPAARRRAAERRARPVVTAA